jgi:hypothetical protein
MKQVFALVFVAAAVIGLVVVVLPLLLVFIAVMVSLMIFCWAVGVPVKVSTKNSDGSETVRRYRWFSLIRESKKWLPL